MKLLFILILLVSLPAVATDTVFRNEEFKFRFEYPSEWIQRTGKGEHVRAKVVAESDGSSCNVIVSVVPELLPFTSEEVMSELTAQYFFEGLKQKFPDAILLKSGNTYLDNKKAIYFFSDYSYRSLSTLVNYRSLATHLYDDGKMYVVTCGSSRELFSKYQPIFENLLRSFVLEYR